LYSYVRIISNILINYQKIIFREYLDIEKNREIFKNIKDDKWISCDDIAGLTFMWASGKNRPKNG